MGTGVRAPVQWHVRLRPFRCRRPVALAGARPVGGKAASLCNAVGRQFDFRFGTERAACSSAAPKRAGYMCGRGFSGPWLRSEEHTSELQSLMRISYAVFCLKKKTNYNNTINHTHIN